MGTWHGNPSSLYIHTYNTYIHSLQLLYHRVTTRLHINQSSISVLEIGWLLLNRSLGNRVFLLLKVILSFLFRKCAWTHFGVHAIH